MPRRKIPFVEGEYYHVFNRSLDRKPIFVYKKRNQRAIESFVFYQHAKPTVKLSNFIYWQEERKQNFLQKIKKENNYLVKIICYCLMPNHYHLLLRQKAKEGISRFVSQFQNSFTRYFNTKIKRKGHLFESQFKAVRIETEEQLIHLSRYIHLNPYSSYVVKEIEDLVSYPYSSFREYLNKEKGFCDKNIITAHFKDGEAYKKFVFDQADYQRNLEKIKHMVFDD